MTKSLTFLPPVVLTLILAACSQEVAPAPEVVGADEKADQIAAFDDPRGLLGAVDTRLAANIAAADIGKSFGVPDGSEPYPDTYWPMTENGVDVEWNGDVSPLEKFVTLTNPSKLEAAKEWNRTHHGKDVPNVADWWGICNGWTGSAIYEAPVKKPVLAKLEDGHVKACAAEGPGCVKFEIGDINAMLAESYLDAETAFIGGRCDTKPTDIKRDANGRIDRAANGRGCKGLNPGAFLVVLGQRMKKDRKPFAIDAQNERNTDQIWNQPAYEYTVNRFEALSEVQAANLVATGARTGAQTKYRWNAKAKGFAFVDVTLHWVSENGPNTDYVSGRQSSRTTRMVAVIELDAPATSAAAKIIGGEYVDDASVGANRLRTAPFVWLVTAPASDRTGGSRNPYIVPSRARELAALGQR